MPLILGQSIIGPTLAITFVILGLLLSLMGSWMLCRALWPARVERAAERCAARPILSFFVGLPIVGVTLLIVGILGKAAGPYAALPNLIILTTFYFFAAVGVAGLATHIGRRLESPTDDIRPWRMTLRGGIVLALSYLMPVVGWFAVTLVSLLIGTGANALTYFARRKPLAPPPPLGDALGARISGAADQAALTGRHEEALR